jgi:tail tube protein
MSGALGVQAKLGMGAASPVTEPYEFLTDNLRLEQTIADLSAIRGTRSHPKERSRETQRTVTGNITMNPTPVELTTLLPRILGAAAVGTTFSLAETLPEFFVTSDRVTKVLTFNGCKVNRATFRATVGGPLELDMEIFGKDEAVGAAGSFPALSIDVASPPFILADLALTLAGVPYKCDQWEMMVDNTLEVRYANSLTPTEINETDRQVTMTTRIPYVDGGTLYGSGSAGVAATAVFTNGAVSITFTLPAFIFPKASPVVDGRGEEWLPIAGPCRKSGATAELTVTLDSTP